MKKVLILIASFSLSLLPATAQTAAPLVLQKTISLPGVSGGFDHFAINLGEQVLFAAAKDHHTIEVVDLKTEKVIQSIGGLKKPHGLAWIPETSRLYVADGGLSQLKVYQGTTLQLTGTLNLSDDADDMVYDKQNGMLYVGHGGADAANPARVAAVKLNDFTLAANLAVIAHPEAIDVDEQGQRIFANIAGASEIAVINATTNRVETTWKVNGAADNTPLAYDAEDHLLFVACRKPAVLVVFDATTGRELSRLPADGGADDLFYDPSHHRIYVTAGSGAVDIYAVLPRGHMTSLGNVRTQAGAKTGLFVPSQNLLYVGVPGTGARPSEIRVYSLVGSGENQ
jgi:DNA-binding beta-propeller fold protein YncE